METKQALSNTFTGGLNTDLHPLITPNTVLTDCVNGTILTNNGNEYSLQNDFGNYALTKAKLPVNYIPIGIKEYNGIVYIVSYNPIEERSQIGTFPSPQKLNQIECVEASDQLKPIEIVAFDDRIYASANTKCFYSKYSKEATEVTFNSIINVNDLYKLEIEDGVLEQPFQKLNFKIINDSGVTKSVPFTVGGDFIRFKEPVSGRLKLAYELFEVYSGNTTIGGLSRVSGVNNKVSFTIDSQVKVDLPNNAKLYIEVICDEYKESGELNFSKKETFEVDTHMFNGGTTIFTFNNTWYQTINPTLNKSYLSVKTVPYFKMENGKAVVLDQYIQQTKLALNTPYASNGSDESEDTGMLQQNDFGRFRYTYDGGGLHLDFSFYEDEDLGELSKNTVCAFYRVTSGGVQSAPETEVSVEATAFDSNNPDNNYYEGEIDVTLRENMFYVMDMVVKSKRILRTLIVTSTRMNNVDNNIQNFLELTFNDWAKNLDIECWANVSTGSQQLDVKEYVQANTANDIKSFNVTSSPNAFAVSPKYTTDYVVGNWRKSVRECPINTKYNYEADLGDKDGVELESNSTVEVKYSFNDGSTSTVNNYNVKGKFDIQWFRGMFNNINKDPDKTMNYDGKRYYLLNESPFKTLSISPHAISENVDTYHFKKKSFTTLDTKLYKIHDTVHNNVFSKLQTKESLVNPTKIIIDETEHVIHEGKDVTFDLGESLDQSSMFFVPIYIDGITASGYSIPHYNVNDVGVNVNPIVMYGANTIGLKTSGENTYLTIPMWGVDCNYISNWMYDYSKQIPFIQLLGSKIYTYRKSDINKVDGCNVIKLGDDVSLSTTKITVKATINVTIKQMFYEGFDIINNKVAFLNMCGLNENQCTILNTNSQRPTKTVVFEETLVLDLPNNNVVNEFKTIVQNTIDTVEEKDRELEEGYNSEGTVYCEVSELNDSLDEKLVQFANNLEVKNGHFYLKDGFNENPIAVKPQSFVGSTNLTNARCNSAWYSEWNYNDNPYDIAVCAGMQDNMLSLVDNDFTSKWTEEQIKTKLEEFSQSFKDTNNEGYINN